MCLQKNRVPYEYDARFYRLGVSFVFVSKCNISPYKCVCVCACVNKFPPIILRIAREQEGVYIMLDAMLVSISTAHVNASACIFMCTGSQPRYGNKFKLSSERKSMTSRAKNITPLLSPRTPLYIIQNECPRTFYSSLWWWCVPCRLTRQCMASTAHTHRSSEPYFVGQKNSRAI